MRRSYVEIRVEDAGLETGDFPKDNIGLDEMADTQVSIKLLKVTCCESRLRQRTMAEEVETSRKGLVGLQFRCSHRFVELLPSFGRNME